MRRTLFRSVTAHLFHRTEQATQLLAVVLRPLGDFTDLTFHARRQTGNIVQLPPGLLDLLDAALEVHGQLLDLRDHLGRALLDIGDHYPDLIGGCGRFCA